MPPRLWAGISKVKVRDAKSESKTGAIMRGTHTPHSTHTQTHTHTLQSVCTLYIVHSTTHEGSWSAFVFVANLDPYPHLFIYVFNLSFFSVFCPVFALNLHVFYIPICSLLKYKLKLLLLLMLLLLLLLPLLYHCIAFTVCGQTSLSLFMICFWFHLIIKSRHKASGRYA